MKVKNAAKSLNEEGREGKMSLSCSKVRRTLTKRVPKAYVC